MILNYYNNICSISFIQRHLSASQLVMFAWWWRWRWRWRWWERRGEERRVVPHCSPVASLWAATAVPAPSQHINRWYLRQSPGTLRVSGGKTVVTREPPGLRPHREGNLKRRSIKCQLILIEMRRIFHIQPKSKSEILF